MVIVFFFQNDSLNTENNKADSSNIKKIKRFDNSVEGPSKENPLAKNHEIVFNESNLKTISKCLNQTFDNSLTQLLNSW